MSNKFYKKIVSITLSTLVALPCVVNFNPNNNISAITFEQAQSINAILGSPIFTQATKDKVNAINAYIEEHKNGTNIDVKKLPKDSSGNEIFTKFELLAALWFDFRTVFKATPEDSVAWHAAWSAAWNAAWDTAWSAAWSAAEDAAEDDAEDDAGFHFFFNAFFARAWLPGGASYKIIQSNEPGYYNNLIKVLIEQIEFLKGVLPTGIHTDTSNTQPLTPPSPPSSSSPTTTSSPS